MENINIEKFDPTAVELNKMIDVTKNITATDLKDKKQLEIVKENRISLKNARVKIQKIGKELREDALAYQKAVIAKEKELIGIIEPEEERLSKIEEEAKKLVIIEERKTKIPERQEKLMSIGNTDTTEEKLLSMGDNEFDYFFNTLVEENQRKIAEQLELERQQLEIEKNKIQREKEIEEAKQKAVEEEKKRQSEQLELENLRKEKERQELEKQTIFIEFKKSYGWTEETKDEYQIIDTSSSYIIYKKLGELKK